MDLFAQAAPDWYNQPIVLAVAPTVVAALLGFIAVRQQRIISANQSKDDTVNKKLDDLSEGQRGFKEALARHEQAQQDAAERAKEKFQDIEGDLTNMRDSMVRLASKVESDSSQIHARMDRMLERLALERFAAPPSPPLPPAPPDNRHPSQY